MQLEEAVCEVLYSKIFFTHFLQSYLNIPFYLYQIFTDPLMMTEHWAFGLDIK